MMDIDLGKSICSAVVALGESLVFNVASQKNAISDGFYPFIAGAHHVSRSNWHPETKLCTLGNASE